MNLTTRFLLSGVVIVCAVTVFFHGCPLAPKRHTEKTERSDSTLRTIPFSKSSPVYQAAKEYREWLSGDKSFAEKAGGLSLADKFLLSGRYIDKGAARLPTALLEERLSSVSKILASLDTHTCGRYLKGEMPYSEFENRIFPVMESFSEAESKAWFTVNRAAIEAQLNGSPIIVLSAEDAKRTIRKLLSSMYEPQSKEFLAALGSLKTADDDDACRTARVLYVQGNSLPEPYRGYMARMLLTRDEGREEP
ncbi:hypothetical protein BCh11DRAFT_06730 [Burkholderia sp. Ch1-1]|uniref:Uncharacterized protein n=1 Tax=Paraburkholderia dioscoreae TaxID=2604047 RepID=A0A5Q4ZDC6_9BURK|nr:hypothetical protein [Paraburkholderia dioscoreae]EIF31214.1 hypothetical protein BCh11DRAFT_06730 [Burkholderia sp. Ch1-1]VVD28578.1 conserved protein of unknown function [Paraburkholderia dioscoreae]